jgi:hypothetical protein
MFATSRGSAIDGRDDGPLGLPLVSVCGIENVLYAVGRYVLSRWVALSCQAWGEVIYDDIWPLWSRRWRNLYSLLLLFLRLVDMGTAASAARCADSTCRRLPSDLHGQTRRCPAGLASLQIHRPIL